eukprot:scaffold62112_cov35-Phaeocystis_antarctica.AAC.2
MAVSARDCVSTAASSCSFSSSRTAASAFMSLSECTSAAARWRDSSASTTISISRRWRAWFRLGVRADSIASWWCASSAASSSSPAPRAAARACSESADSQVATQ